ncbi:MAG: type II toxin-antitoxin system RelE/ParE family toxin [Patescibacteria group bacterium]
MRLIILKEVDAFIETLEKSTQSKWLRHLTLLEQYGKPLGMPHVRYMSGGILELRIRGLQEIRAFFIFKDDYAIIAHTFIKKTQKTPKRELDIAQKRISKLLTGI